MMAYFQGYPGLDPDDKERLNALAASTLREPMTFDEAYALLDANGSPREVAERAWDDFMAYYHPVGKEPPEEAPEFV